MDNLTFAELLLIKYCLTSKLAESEKDLESENKGSSMYVLLDDERQSIELLIKKIDGMRNKNEG